MNTTISLLFTTSVVQLCFIIDIKVILKEFITSRGYWAVVSCFEMTHFYSSTHFGLPLEAFFCSKHFQKKLQQGMVGRMCP